MSDQPGDILGEHCSDAQNLIIAAPYIKVDALTKILDDTNPAASLICITRWNPHDLAIGASDTECRTIVNERGGSFRLHQSLHAKYYRMDHKVLVGSANLTASAMGWSTETNLEILCHPGDDFDVCTFQRELLKDAREISDDEFARWETIARIGARNIDAVSGSPPRLGSWRPSTRDPRHLVLAYHGREEEIASFDEQGAAVRDVQALAIPTGLSHGEIQAWVATSLLSTSFADAVIQLYDKEPMSAARILAQSYSLSITEARRDMETVQNWLASLAPDTLPTH